MRCWPVPFDIITENHVMLDQRKVRKWLTCLESRLEISLSGINENNWIVISLQLQGNSHYIFVLYLDFKFFSILI